MTEFYRTFNDDGSTRTLFRVRDESEGLYLEKYDPAQDAWVATKTGHLWGHLFGDETDGQQIAEAQIPEHIAQLRQRSVA